MRATSEVIVKMIAANRPLLVWGTPGVGKTAGVSAAAEAAGYRVMVLVGNCRAPEDFAGLPYIEGGVARYAGQGWAVDANEHGGPVLVILDELTTATPAVMAAMLRVIQERHVGDVALADHVRIVALANPPTLGGHLRPLPAALANRFVHLDFEVDVEQWERWMTATHRGDALGPILGFLRARRDLLAPAPPMDATTAGGAWPSPRSWDAACAICSTVGSGWAGMVAAAVGASAGAEFAAWMDAADLPDTRTVMADPGKVGWSRMRPDQVFAVLCSVAIAGSSGDQADRDAAYRVLEVVGDHAPDLGVAALSALITSDPAATVPFGRLGAYGAFLDTLSHLRR